MSNEKAAARFRYRCGRYQSTGIKVETKEFHAWCATKLRAKLMANQRKKYMADFDADGRARFGRALDVANSILFRNLVVENFDKVQRMNRSKKIRKLRARKFAAKQHAMAKAANKLTKCKDDERVVLLYGRGSEKDGFTSNGIKAIFLVQLRNCLSISKAQISHRHLGKRISHQYA